MSFLSFKKIRRNVVMLGLVSFFNDLSNEMILSIFPAFFSSVLKSGAAALGLVEGVADALSNLTKIASGHFSDKIQKRKGLAMLGYTISVATRPFYLIAGSVGGILGIRVVDRLGKGIREAPRDALLSLSADPQAIGESFGYHRAMDTLGSVLGPLIAFLILRKLPHNFNAVFLTAFIFGLGAIFSFIFVKDVVGTIQNNKKFHWLHDTALTFKLFMISMIVVGMGSIPLAVLLLRVKDLAINQDFIPLFYLVYSLSYALISYFAGKVADKIGEPSIIISGYCILIISYMCLIFSSNFYQLGGSFIILGLFSALTDGVQRSYVAHLVLPQQRGSAFGFLSASLGLGSLLSGIGMGYVWQHFGAPHALLIATSAVLIGIILFIISQNVDVSNPPA